MFFIIERSHVGYSYVGCVICIFLGCLIGNCFDACGQEENNVCQEIPYRCSFKLIFVGNRDPRDALRCGDGHNIGWIRRGFDGVGLDNGLVPNRRQAIIWTNAEPIHWRTYAALEGGQ